MDTENYREQQEHDTQQLDSEEEQEYDETGENVLKKPQYHRTGSPSDHDEFHGNKKRRNSALSDHNHRHENRRRRSGDNSDDSVDRKHRSRRSSRQHDDRDGHRRRHHRRHKDKSRHTSKRHNDSRSSVEFEKELELEDGELEDGEIDEEEIEGYNPLAEDKDLSPSKESSSGSPAKLEKQRISGEKSPRKLQREINVVGQSEEVEQESYEPNAEDGSDDDDDENEGGNEERKSEGDRKKKKDKIRERKKKNKDDKKKKKRKVVYHDYDKVEEEFEQEWGAPSSGSSKHSRDKRSTHNHGARRNRDRSPVGPYESPYHDSHEQFDMGYDVSGPYDSPYDSPPGPYDSPSSEDEYYGEGNQNRTMMSMVEDEYLDANIVVDEGENIYKRQGSKKLKNNKHMMKRKMDRQHVDQPPKKKPLLLTPMNERPVCKFFKEGKCSKGDDCPFNHDYLPPKRPDLCKFYLNGSCSKGNGCIFMHEEFPCKFFHTGAKCYSGDNCKFSHAPLNEETRPIVEKFYHDTRGDDEANCDNFGGRPGTGPPRPSLLGAPPPHIIEAAERIKKIPSIFDIKVFPPGQSPKKNMSDCPPQGPPLGPPKGPPPGPHGPPHGPPQGPPRHPCPPGPHGPPPRPSGFYQDMNQPQMNQPPINQPPLNQPPPQMGPPPVSAPMNPAVALVGALLRQAAPQVLRPNIHPPGPMQNMQGPFTGQNGPPSGPRPFGPPPGQFGPPSGPPPDMITSPPHQLVVGDGPVQGEDPLEQGSQDGRDEDSQTSQDGNESSKPVDSELDTSKSVTVEDESNDKKLASLGLNLETFNHLPAKQRELFLRIQNQQAVNDTEEEQKVIKEGDEKRDSQIEEDGEKEEEEKVDDDDWYSSDDEEGDKPKLTDILKNLTKQTSKPESPQTPRTSSEATKQTSAISIMQMINNIRSHPGGGASPASDISQQTIISKNSQQDGAEVKRNVDPRSPPVSSSVHNFPPPVIVNSSEGDIPYKLRPLNLEKCKPSLPSNLDTSEPQFKNDPRIKKYPSAPVDPPTTKPSVRPLDPRMKGQDVSLKSDGSCGDPQVVHPAGQVTDRPFDPRIKRQNDQHLEQSGEIGGRPCDPRLQKSVSDMTFMNRSNDPRLLRSQSNPHMGVHTLPVRSVDPRLARQDPGPPKAADPRLHRQQSREISSPGTQPKLDPRLGRQMSGQFYSGPDSLTDNLVQTNDPRFGRGSDIGGHLPPLESQKLQEPPAYPRQFQRQGSVSGMDQRKKPLLPDPPCRQGLLPLPDTKGTDLKLGVLAENSDNIKQNMTQQAGQSVGDNESKSSETSKPKLDYRNDPRFKRKPASEAVLAQKRFTGQRKGSMEYSSPLGMDSDSGEGPSGYNSYNRPPSNIENRTTNNVPSKQDPRFKSKLEPSTLVVGNKLESGSLSPGTSIITNPNPALLDMEGDKSGPKEIPQLAPFVPPPGTALEPKMKEFFKTMDPTASPFC